MIVTNAKVYTVDNAMPRAEAFAIRDGKFVAVGKSDEISGLAGKGTQRFDAKGMTIVPGFIDCHNHAPGNVLMYEAVVGNPYVVEFVTIQSIIDKLKARAATLPAGTWVEGYFHDDTKVKDNRIIDVHDLRFQQITLWPCIIVAATRLSTTARPCRWQGSQRTPPILSAAPTIRMPKVS
jgi:predicted amidohydrolase YtcJ